MEIKIRLSLKARDKIKYWVNRADKEVSGFGVTTREATPTGVMFRVHDVMLLRQKVGAAHTDIDAQAMGILMYRVATEPQYQGMRLNYWWHSHVNMPCFWSGTDQETIRSIGSQGLCLATVFNKKNESRSAACYKVSSELGDDTMLVDDISLSVDDLVLPEASVWEEEFTANVIEEVYNPSLLGSYEYQNVLETSDHSIYGLLGYGLQNEADILGINPKKYLKELNKKHMVTLMDYEARLEKAEKEGRLTWR